MVVNIQDASKSDNTAESPPKQSASPTEKPRSPSTVSWNEENLYKRFLSQNDSPKDWQVQKNQEGLQINATKVKMMVSGLMNPIAKIDIRFEVYVNQSEASQNFDQIKLDAQSTIDNRGISGDKLEDIGDVQPLFVWMQRGNKSFGNELYVAVGLMGNVVFRIENSGMIGAPDINFTTSIAQQQMGKLTN